MTPQVRGVRLRGLRVAGAVLAVLGLWASGCGGSPEGKVEIRYSWWGAKDRAELIQKTVALFEKKHPDITVKTDFQEYGDFWTKFNTQAAGGNPPDVFQNSIGFLKKYLDKNVLLDLRPQVEAGNLRMDGFRDGLESVGEVDGRLLGVPVGVNTFALVYKSRSSGESASPRDPAGPGRSSRRPSRGSAAPGTAATAPATTAACCTCTTCTCVSTARPCSPRTGGWGSPAPT